MPELKAKLFSFGFCLVVSGLSLGLVTSGLGLTELTPWPQNFTADMTFIIIHNLAVDAYFCCVSAATMH